MLVRKTHTIFFQGYPFVFAIDLGKYLEFRIAFFRASKRVYDLLQ